MKRDDPIKGLKAKVHRSERYGTVQRIYTIKDRFEGKPRAVARAFLKRNAVELGLDPSLSGLELESVKQSLLGHHVLFQQMVDGRPLSGAWIRVDLDRNGRVVGTHSNAVPSERVKAARRVRKAIPAAQARRAAAAAVEAAIVDTEAERVFWPVEGAPHDAWKVIVRTSKPNGTWRIYIDAADGAILTMLNASKMARGFVFDPTPMAALRNSRLDYTQEVPAKAYRNVPLLGLDGSGYLDGEHVTTRRTRVRAHSLGGDFRFVREEPGFHEVMVYYHIDSAIRHLMKLGFEGLFKKPVEVKAHGYADDNSEYSPSTKAIIFGWGGVNDAEDAEVILHELGHAIQDAQVPWFGESDEGGAMGEGFGDFFAASFFHDKKPLRMRPTVFNWNASAYSDSNPPHERRLDLKLKMPGDWADEVHDDGQIWSACLWELRRLLGRRRSERVVIASHYLCMRDSSFSDGAHAILTANERLYGDKDRARIRAVFERRGIIEPK
jgi:Zn-dependent metalloprotease